MLFATRIKIKSRVFHILQTKLACDHTHPTSPADSRALAAPSMGEGCDTRPGISSYPLGLRAQPNLNKPVVLKVKHLLVVVVVEAA